MLLDPPDRPPRTPNEWGVMAVLSFFFGLFLVLDLAQNYGVEKLSVPFFLVSWVILLVIHELGHVVAARILGWKVERICIGTGKVRLEGRWCGMPVEWRTLPLSGFVVPRPVSRRAPRIKHCLIFSAGPGFELLAVALVAVILGPESLLSASEDPARIALQSFCLAAVLGAAFNLLPLSHSNGGGEKWSDGLGMILCWTLREEDYEKLRAVEAET